MRSWWKDKVDMTAAESKVNEVLHAVVEHVTRAGTAADDEFAAKVYELSGGKVGHPARDSQEATDEA